MNTSTANPVATGAPVAEAVASIAHRQLSCREEAALLGVSKSTVATRRRKAAEAAPQAPASAPVVPNVTAALQALALLLPSLMGSTTAPAIRLPQVPAADPTPAEPEKPAKPVAGGSIEAASARIRAATGRRFVLTSAQNNTHVHHGFLDALLTYCKHNGSQLLVAPFTYNKGAWEQRAGVITAHTDDLWYDPAVEPYLSREPLRLAPSLLWCADFDRLPTATEPLSGLLDYTGASSGVFPHIQMRMESVATGNHEPTKFLYTTGCVTQRNFIQRAAGKKAEANLKWAALAVEVDEDGAWFARQLEANDDGVFHDLTHEYSADGFRQVQVAGVTWFDIHSEKADETILGASFDGPDSILDVLQPGEQHIEDLTDFEARNHHNRGSAHFRARMLNRGTASVEGGMRTAAGFLKRCERDWCRTVVVESNHDQAFLRWLDEADGHHDEENAEYWHRWNAEVFKAIREKRDNYLVFEEAVREHAPGLRDTVFLREDQGHLLLGIECGEHGHRGKRNGSKGGHKNYRGRGCKVNRADQHSAGIYFDTFTAGASSMRMGLQQGAVVLESFAHRNL